MPDRLSAEQLTALGHVHAAAAIMEVDLKPYPGIDLASLAESAKNLSTVASAFADTLTKE